MDIKFKEFFRTKQQLLFANSDIFAIRLEKRVQSL